MKISWEFNSKKILSIYQKISKLNNLYFYPTPFTRLQWLSAVGCIWKDCGSQKWPLGTFWLQQFSRKYGKTSASEDTDNTSTLPRHFMSIPLQCPCWWHRVLSCRWFGMCSSCTQAKSNKPWVCCTNPAYLCCREGHSCVGWMHKGKR